MDGIKIFKKLNQSAPRTGGVFLLQCAPVMNEQQVLYRKYRPQTFADVIGQEHIISVLTTAIANNSFAHAYLFTGTRGTGKTSVARIVARELGANPEDIVEIDAASNRGIDDIRALREAVRVMPFSSPYKVYIIDEVHMLSKDAFNALLKTLEEPPAHVVFILATTELDKVPETILSRCQVFTFKKPNEKTLTALVQKIAKEEGYTLDTESAELVAFLGDGSFRDTFGILQKILSATENRIVDRAFVERITGAPSLSVVLELFEALIENNIDKAYKTLNRAAEANTEMGVLIKLLLELARLSLMYRHAPSMRDEITAAHSERYTELVVRGAVEGVKTVTSNTIVVLITALERLSYASVPILPLELAFVELLGSEASK